jgi:vancomycin resistance protein VanJ
MERTGPVAVDGGKGGHPPAAAVRRALLAGSTLLGLSLSFCYGTRSDGCAAVTVFPVWLWLVPGLFLLGLGWSRSTRRASTAVGILWLLYALIFSDEPAGLFRTRAWPAAGWEAARTRGKALRVVTLNCAGGMPEAAAEVTHYSPDIILLQESPDRREVEQLARQLFGTSAGVLAGPDASIIARGSLLPRPLPPVLRSYFVQASVRLSTGIKVEVISLRLAPGIVREDLWSPDCWREQTANRRARREQLRAVARQIDRLARETPLIFGGDFNAPAGDAVFRLLQPDLRDSFREGGTGWGNTIVNDMPVHRIDQVWISPAFRTAAVVARKTRHSDHRLVVCDLWVR